MKVAVLPPAYMALNIVETAKRDGIDPLEVARVHFALGERLGLSMLVSRILALPRDDRWQTMARAALRDDLHTVHAQLTAQVLADTDGRPAGAGPDRRLGGPRRRRGVALGGHAGGDLLRRARRPRAPVGRAARGQDAVVGSVSPGDGGAAEPAPGAAIEVVGLRKSYGDLAAVDDVSFTVESGEFFGILGPNGAGKTTTLEMVEGLRRPDAGEVRLLGEPSWPRNPRLLPRIGVQLQASAFFERLTAREQIRTFASLYDVPAARADDWLERVGLTDKAGTRTEKLSGGQLQRLAIACALVHDPEVVFLDEPTAALDPQARRNLWDLLRSLNEAGPDRRADHPLHGRGGGALRPGRDHGPRPGPAAGLAGRPWCAGSTPRCGSWSPRTCCRRTTRGGSPASTRRGRRRGLVLTTRARLGGAHPAGRARRARGAAGEGGHPRGRLPAPHRPRVPSMSTAMTAFRAIAIAIVKGFVRDKMSMFFAVVFPLMFLVLFGGVFNYEPEPAHRPGRGRPRPAGRRAVTRGAGRPSTRPSRSPASDDLDAAVRTVRKGDADVADRDARRHPRRALHADRPGQGRHHAGHAQRVRGRRQPGRLRAAAALRAAHRAGRGQVAEDHPVRDARPARLGGRDERGVRGGRHACRAGATASCCAGCSSPRCRRPRWSPPGWW